jgi:cytosine/adenosine deaminase-related metal-dependent hydrolase
MILQNLELPGKPEKSWIGIKGDFITNVGPAESIQIHPGEAVINIADAIAFPGLVNSHEHLEFNLFPKLGNRKYSDYVEWGEDIHKTDKRIIEEIQKIPVSLRTEYGIYKNVFNGVTTVVNHGSNIFKKNYPVSVFPGYNYLHSIRLEKNWRAKLNLKPNALPFVIHVGEGTNPESYSEINQLIRWNLFNRALIGVHGIAMDKAQAEHFKALVWCPVSNDFLYGSTCRVDKLKENTSILFGTDSNVSADWNIWQHLRYAKKTCLLNDLELYEAVTTCAVKIWKLHNLGIISSGMIADLVIAEKKTGNFFDSFFSVEPWNILMLIKHGKIILFDSQFSNLSKQLEIDTGNFTGIKIGGKIKYIKGRLDKLCRDIVSYSDKVSFPFQLINP